VCSFRFDGQIEIIGVMCHDHYSTMSYGIIFWGNLPYMEKIFKMPKRVIRIITNSRVTESCRELFKKMKILPLYSQYVFSL
jgi:biotin synthase-related radical SAM superfamily protein